MTTTTFNIDINVIGVVFDALGIYQFAADQVFSRPDDPASSSSLRVHIGSGAQVPNAGGNIGAVKVYNGGQQLIGAGSGDGKIPYGSFQDIKVEHGYGPGQQPTYVQLNSEDDGVCIAYLIQTWPDGTQRGWLGDMGQACGANWAYSNVIVGTSHKPSCTWLDQNHDNIQYASMQIHMQDFTNLTTDYSTNTSHYCAWPAIYFEPRTERTGLPDNQIWGSSATSQKRGLARKQGLEKRSRKLASTIIGSNDEAHSAIQLCESETSLSSDFVSFVEGVYCDMDTKTAWPLCRGVVKRGCYEWKTHILVGKDGTMTEKVYKHVQQWD